MMKLREIRLTSILGKTKEYIINTRSTMMTTMKTASNIIGTKGEAFRGLCFHDIVSGFWYCRKTDKYFRTFCDCMKHCC